MPSAERPSWAARIEQERVRRGWSVARAASYLRKRDPTMPPVPTLAKYWSQRWESGKHRPDDRHRHHLCALLGIPHDVFIDGYTHGQLVPYPPAGMAPSLKGDGAPPTGEELIVMAARESADYGRRHGTSNVHPVTLDQLAADARELATDFVSSAPVPVVLRARAARDETFELLDGRQAPDDSRHLYSIAGRLCGLLSVASSDFFGRYDAAATQCRTAWLCAEMADDDELRSWVRALQSGVSLWAGRWQDAALKAAQAREYARTGASSVRAAALEGRALARLGDRAGVDRAVGESEDGWSLPDSPEAVGVMGFTEANRVRCAGTAYMWLGASQTAGQHLEAALITYERDEPGAYAFVAVTRADLASVRLDAGDLDGAAEALQPVLTLTAERRLEGAARRMSSLRAKLVEPGYRDSPLAGQLAEQIEHFRSELATLVAGD